LIACNLRCSFTGSNLKNGERLIYGGRFYSYGKNHFQSLSQDERKTICFNGEASCELDYSSLHISMLYAMAGHQLDVPAYGFLGKENKTICKKMLLVAINCSSERELKNAMNNIIEKLKKKTFKEMKDWEIKFFIAWTKIKPDWIELLQRFKEYHKIIAEDICNPEHKICNGLILQNKDSQIIMDVIAHFIEKGIPCLPIHDSVIVPLQHKEELREVMETAYSKHMNGFKCKVEEK
jgi:hypothetical protein